MTLTLTKKKQRGCESKRAFATKEEAVKSGQKFGMRTYKCDYCTGYHLTRLKKKK